MRVRREEHYFRNYTFYISDLPKINVLHKKSEIKKKILHISNRLKRNN